MSRSHFLKKYIPRRPGRLVRLAESVRLKRGRGLREVFLELDSLDLSATGGTAEPRSFMRLQVSWCQTLHPPPLQVSSSELQPALLQVRASTMFTNMACKG